MTRLLLAAAALLLAACASTNDHHDAQDSAALAASAADSYVLTACPVSGEPLPAEGYSTANVAGHETRFCCASCASMAAADPATWGPLIEQSLIEVQVDDYPLTTCAVAGTELGSMGEPVDVLAGDTLVRLCCAGCANAVKADPDKYAAIVAEARR
ncbi:hypothetical protein [Engelhardtia mirabilis]|uniref:Lipoprotein n=1 Tax=Engelhardtia mirabilis TaxID=2528011 RepID=A0A518BDB9_9BACT|nr:hypothetical protein Pla133_00410 [Planctomycetes bacterium Pla133]QDU99305.1 hypothetical protein Pla86_00410 [Planctomycetes bacterium Pla86]